MSNFNGEKWISQAIESIINQTFRNFNLIIIDDGSTDESVKIINSFSDQRIHLVRNKNIGLTNSLIYGASLGCSKWIARIDSDDICHKERFEKQINFLNNNKEVILLGSNFKLIDENGKILKKKIYRYDDKRLKKNLLNMGKFFPHSSSIFRRDCYQNVGGYNKYIKKSQDYDLWLRLINQGSFYIHSDLLVSIRIHNKQISYLNKKDQFFYSNMSQTLFWIRKFNQSDPSKLKDEDFSKFYKYFNQQYKQKNFHYYFNIYYNLRTFYKNKYIISDILNILVSVWFFNNKQKFLKKIAINWNMKIYTKLLI